MTIFKTPKSIRDTHNFGGDSREWVLHFNNVQLLGARNIEAVGWVDARDGYFHARQVGAFDMLYVCLEGWGEVWIQGQWLRCTPGTAFLSPAGQPQIYRAVPGVTWRNCWVLGRAPSFLGVMEPMLVSASGKSLLCAIQGLYYEDNDRSSLNAVEYWVELILTYARRIGTSQGRPHARLRGVWERVLADLAAPWSVSTLSEIASLSEESIRRICIAETGRSPMEHVTFLRMRSAASLLATQPGSVATVAQRVGYNNPMAFSTAFRRVMGCSPRQYRAIPGESEVSPG